MVCAVEEMFMSCNLLCESFGVVRTELQGAYCICFSDPPCPSRRAPCVAIFLILYFVFFASVFSFFLRTVETDSVRAIRFESESVITANNGVPSRFKMVQTRPVPGAPKVHGM